MKGDLSKITLLLVVFGLLFTCTNIVPWSIIPFAWICCFVPISLITSTKLPRLTLYAFLYLAYSLLSVLYYDPIALTQFDFFRYDGNYFITFLPFLILPLLPQNLRVPDEKIIKLFASISVLISLLPCIYQYSVGNFSTGYFLATNAFGGFLMIILSFSFSWLNLSKNRVVPMVLIFLSLSMLFMSGSRGSLFGIISALLIYFCFKWHIKFAPVILLSVVIGIKIMILTYTFPVYSGNPTFSVSSAIQKADTGKEANIYIRAYENWPRGLFLFFNSPIIGTGVGSVNDFPFDLSDTKLFQFNNSNIREYNSSHAHDTYLQILAEQGLVGLVLFLLMWRSLYTSIITRYTPSLTRDGLFIAFWALNFASFTEHRIPSPSNAFPFILIYILFYMNQSNFKPKLT